MSEVSQPKQLVPISVHLTSVPHCLSGRAVSIYNGDADCCRPSEQCSCLNDSALSGDPIHKQGSRAHVQLTVLSPLPSENVALPGSCLGRGATLWASGWWIYPSLCVTFLSNCLSTRFALLSTGGIRLEVKMVVLPRF